MKTTNIICRIFTLVLVTLRSVSGQVECTLKADLVFVVDGSGSICDIERPPASDPNCNNWRTVRSFLRSVTTAFTIGEDDVKIGLVTFGNQGRLVFTLSSDRSEILQEIDNLSYPGGNTNTSGGIKVMRQIFSSATTRSDAQKVAIVFTDGQSTKDSAQTIPQAEAAQLEGVRIFVVGVTSFIDIDEIKAISSQPQELNTTYFTSTDFASLGGVQNALVQETCVTPSPPPVIDTCGNVIVDLTFVVDGSASICEGDPILTSNGCQNWELVLSFIEKVINQLTIGPKATRVALITFASYAELKWNLNRFTDKSTLIQEVRNVRYPRGDTHTAAGLNMMNEQVYTGNEAQSGDRPDVYDMAIVITDGKSTTNSSLTIPTAQRSHSKNIDILALGITPSVNEVELRAISSDPKELDTNYFMAPDFKRLDEVLDVLLAAACVTPGPVFGCANEADVVFILDSSGSIGQENFDKIKVWLASSVLASLDVDSGKIRVGMITFGDDARRRWGLAAFNNSQDIKDAILQLPYTHGKTSTGRALRLAGSFVFQKQGDRVGVPDIIVLLTDGGSNDKKRTAAEASLAKSFGIHIVTVGMGDWIDKYELYMLASHPHQSNAIEVPDYNDLTSFTDRIQDIICNNVDDCANNPCKNGGQCLDMIDMYICECPSPYGGVHCEYRCREPAHFSLALDSSGSIGRDNFLLMLDFAKRLMMELPIEGGLAIAIEKYADDTETIVYGTEFSSRLPMLNTITANYYSGGTTNTAAALQSMRTSMFTPGDISRPIVGLVVTDGQSNHMEDTFTEAMLNRNDDIEMLALGVGGNYRMEELEGIVSWPTTKNVFTVDRFTNLKDAVADIRDAICNAVDECSPNPCKNGGVCRDRRNGYNCECLDGFTGMLCERRCAALLDLAIVVDKSGSIQNHRFPLVKQFLADVLYKLEMWQDKVRIAAVSFDDDATLHFNLDTYAARAHEAIQMIKRIPYGGGRTNIAAALNLVRTQVFQESNGARSLAPKVVLLFTDGSSTVDQENTIPTAIATRIDGARIMTVAVGYDINMMEIYGISSLPSEGNVFTTRSFYNLSSLVTSVVAGTCNDVDDCLSSPCRNGAQCVDSYEKYSCICTEDWTGERCQSSCPHQNDVAFALDLSGSVQENYNLTIEFTKEIVNSLDFKKDRARVAVVTFATTAKIQFLLNRYNQQQDVLEALTFMPTGGKTNTQAALKLVGDVVFKSDNGDRPGIPNKLIIITDGSSNIFPENTVPEAEKLRGQGVEISVVAVGANVDPNEVEGMASTEFDIYPVSTSTDVLYGSGLWVSYTCLDDQYYY